MLFGLFVLLACQLLGEALVRLLGVPVPGPVLGILLLFGCLAVADRLKAGAASGREAPVGKAADGLLGFLGLLFVPAGVGVAQSSDLILANGVGIVSVLVLSTLATLLATVATFRLLRRLSGKDAA